MRPELLYGSFTCIRCGTLHNSVDQQYVYTEPHVCRNVDCSNKGLGHFNRYVSLISSHPNPDLDLPNHTPCNPQEHRAVRLRGLAAPARAGKQR